MFAASPGMDSTRFQPQCVMPPTGRGASWSGRDAGLLQHGQAVLVEPLPRGAAAQIRFRSIVGAETTYEDLNNVLDAPVARAAPGQAESAALTVKLRATLSELVATAPLALGRRRGLDQELRRAQALLATDVPLNHEGALSHLRRLALTILSIADLTEESG